MLLITTRPARICEATRRARSNRAGERNLGHVRIACKLRADNVAEPRHNIQEALAEIGLVGANGWCH